MLKSMFHTSSVVLLLCVHKGARPLVTHSQLIPALPLNLTSLFVLFSVRGFLAECIFHSHPPVLHTGKPLMYAEARRIKLKAHNYPSQRSGDSDPVTAEDKHVNQTIQEATAHLWSQQISWSGCDLQTGGLQVPSWFGTPMLLMDLFRPLICSPLLCVLSVLCVCSAGRIEFQHFSLSSRNRPNALLHKAWILLQNNNATDPLDFEVKRVLFPSMSRFV